MAESYEGAFQSTDLEGAEVLVRLDGETAQQDSDIYALTEFVVTPEPRGQARLPTVNAGTKTAVGSPGQVTGTVTVYVDDDATGQDKITESHRTQKKLIITTKTFGDRLTQTAITLSSSITFEVAADGTLGNADLVEDLADITGAGVDLRGCKIVLAGTANSGAQDGRYFIERVEFADNGSVSRIKIGAERANRTGWPFKGTAQIPAQQTGTLHLYNRPDATWTYKGVAQNPVGQGTLTASTEGDNIPQATISIALDNEGQKATAAPTT